MTGRTTTRQSPPRSKRTAAATNATSWRSPSTSTTWTVKRPDPGTDERRAEIAEVVYRLCRLFGAGVGTSHLVAGEFVRGLDREAG